MFAPWPNHANDSKSAMVAILPDDQRCRAIPMSGWPGISILLFSTSIPLRQHVTLCYESGR